jgi:DNA-binding protein YbaB
VTSPTERLTELLGGMEQAPDLRKYFERVQGELTGLSDTISRILDQVHPGTDESGAVEVEINGRGDIRSLKITARGMKEHSHDSLGPAVVAAINNAYLQMGEQMKAQFEEELGIVPGTPGKVDFDSLIQTDFTKSPKTGEGGRR